MNLRTKHKPDTETYPSWLHPFTEEMMTRMLSGNQKEGLFWVDLHNNNIGLLTFIAMEQYIIPQWVCISGGMPLIKPLEADGKFGLATSASAARITNQYIKYYTDNDTSLLFTSDRSSPQTLAYLEKRYIK